MRIFRQYQHLTDQGPHVVVLGNFDGVHCGHQVLLHTAIQQAHIQSCMSLVMTFDPHPLRFFKGKQGPKALYSAQDRSGLFLHMGIDRVLIQDFNQTFAQLTAWQFFDEVLCKALHAQTIVVGYDFAFAARRAGKVTDLQKWGQEQGIHVIVIEAQKATHHQGMHKESLSSLTPSNQSYQSQVIPSNQVAPSNQVTPSNQVAPSNQTTPNHQIHSSHQQPVYSSTWIRKLVQQGQMQQAYQALGRYYHVRGTVVEGYQRGRQLGFPTANLALQSEICPAAGVYAGYMDWGIGPQKVVISIGSNPTFKGQHKLFEQQDLSFEVHILDQVHDLYDLSVVVWVVQYLRTPRKFDGIEALKKQIQQDCEHTHTTLLNQIVIDWPLVDVQ